ncbi:unnamed protein product [Arctia plantaginis]|uniref:Helicase ATP-binding domain-containing protein n=1 Tax=Arctia plantaginis TaxID=874455 RepID=A0A8S1AKY6_ARCPL|nr:unnamed protein product [Arctia plantaginis]
MNSPYEISDDDESFADPQCSKTQKNDYESILISSDEEPSTSRSFDTSCDQAFEDELPEVVIIQKKNAIAKLFTMKNENKENKGPKKKPGVKVLFPPSSHTNDVNTSPPPVVPHKTLWIGGVNVAFPVSPYGSQIALMYKIIQGIKESKNCILESPTGSGKTLALLCGVLAWQQAEYNRISQQTAKKQTRDYYNHYPELQREDVTDYIATQTSEKTNITPEKLFSKTQFGE